MATLQDWVNAFTQDERPDGIIIDDNVILAQAIAATNFYCGYASTAAQLAIPVTVPAPTPSAPSPLMVLLGNTGYELINYDNSQTPQTYSVIFPPAYPAIDGTAVITVSEWALIKPLFLLYVERENAIQLEASRAMGLDVWGRSVSEIITDIDRYQSEVLPKSAFSAQVIITV